MLTSLLTLGAHVQRGLRYLVCPSVCLCVCLSVCLFYLNSGTTGNKSARERYTHLQRNKRSKNNVADLAKTAAFQKQKPALPWTTFCDLTHQLARCTCVFITRLGVRMLYRLSPWSSSAWSPALLYNATSGTSSLFILYRMAPVTVVVLTSFSPTQLQSHTQIVFAPRVCTLVLFIIVQYGFSVLHESIMWSDVTSLCVMLEQSTAHYFERLLLIVSRITLRSINNLLWSKRSQ